MIIVLPFALWLNLLSSHLMRHLSPNGRIRLFSISMEHTSCRRRKTQHTRSLLLFTLFAICLLLRSVDHIYIIINNFLRRTLGNCSKRLLVLKLGFFRQPPHLLKHKQLWLGVHRCPLFHFWVMIEGGGLSVYRYSFKMEGVLHS